jgi:hypothetical protein
MGDIKGLMATVSEAMGGD